MTGQRPIFSFDYDPSIADFAVPKHTYLSSRPGLPFGYIATSTLVLEISNPSNPRVLLLQRAADDEDPNLWEPPGGACDDDDETILHAAARELWEEAGLEVARFERVVGDPYFFTVTEGNLKVCQFNFAAVLRESSTEVKLDPAEHQRFVWATEQEVTARKAGDVDLEFTRDEVGRTVLMLFEKKQGETGP